MIEGITVINSNAAMELDVSLFFLLLCVTFIGSSIFCGIFNLDFWFAVLATFVFMRILAPTYYYESEDRKRYECFIDDSVSMKEVYERYKIIEQRGDIWVLEDKTRTEVRDSTEVAK